MTVHARLSLESVAVHAPLWYIVFLLFEKDDGMAK